MAQTQADLAFQEGVQSLADWLMYLEQKKLTYGRQLERARSADPTQAATAEETPLPNIDVAASDNLVMSPPGDDLGLPDGWLVAGDALDPEMDAWDVDDAMPDDGLASWDLEDTVPEASPETAMMATQDQDGAAPPEKAIPDTASSEMAIIEEHPEPAKVDIPSSDMAIGSGIDAQPEEPPAPASAPPDTAMGTRDDQIDTTPPDTVMADGEPEEEVDEDAGWL